ncbi:CtsR family transcriptional regulator [Macrococcoides caseolyticum]|uniref:CtsR family transcriptional regulator n=1 Tax=Macrococcoides caseolyticum TaxID=69966 RepID=UPI000C3269AF|nr:CtsR family transcriptional regulator [Macrococcus caseolyticus]MDJ1089650.1 CtsR family transcriptional regulator [Macrococcus caseolyticus]MDJ1091826.1 CtsR family transcriptional regulator [Macrococcus caseolyticus]MDJ1109635.1 CtsR family transcriptional regulator [Macrococcus caseolyticus]MDJ1154257.1 CtsR family transcriptional regulator [Macrococcus caseolyticus]MDJ1156265.1 CtsR family transcriptional regulator [Macrococcus caseolyticus]
MHNMSDIIEQYLKQLLEEATDDVVEIKRAHIAEKFDCVPSQLNYVIKTRFTNEHGYQIESKRGGGGYIRITKIESNDKSAFLNHLKKLTGKQVSQQNAERIIAGLYDNELITLREKKLIMSAIHRDTLMMEVPYRDYIRANILQNVLAIIQYN